MLIGIDGNEANTSNKVGVGQYALNLLLELQKNDKENKYLIYLKNNPSKELPKETDNWQYQVIGPEKLWTRLALPFKLFFQKEKLDLFFSPSHYSPSPSPCPTIPTIHDIGYLHFQDQFTKKDFYQLKNWTAKSIKKAKDIVTVSNFSKNEITKTYSIDPKKVTIAYNGVKNPPAINQKTQAKILSSYQIKTNNYFLCLGTLKPNKNIPFLIKAYSLFLSKNNPKNSSPKLVIAGKKGWLFDEIFKTVKKEKLEDKVVFTDFVTEEQKWTLYQNAIASIIPSTYEGFGIPAIESMKNKTPVIVSDIPPFKEVVQNSGLFIDPKNKSDLCQKMIKVLDPKIKQKYSKLGKIQADKFTWESTALVVINLFNSYKKQT